MDIQTHSEDELGLQLADFFSGEIVDFFKTNEELLTYGSTSRLITPFLGRAHSQWPDGIALLC